jgi:hypothetical protein
MRRLKIVTLVTGCALLFALPLRAQSGAAKCDPSLDLAHVQGGAKGRLQEDGSSQTRHILELGKKAIPLLIACLTDKTRSKSPFANFWPVTAVGDIAFFYLCDLFTDSTWEHSTIDGVVTWKTLEAEYPGSPAWGAWFDFLKTRGRRHVQKVWYEKWEKEEAMIFWDDNEQCFKIGSPATQRNARP